MAVFARTPLPGRAKTRLIPLLGPQGAAQLQAVLILDTTRKVERLTGIARWLFLAGPRSPSLQNRKRWKVARQRGASLSARLNKAFRRLLARHPAAVIIGTDSPLLPPRVLREALNELRVCDSVLGPCPDGGFYLIGLRRAIAGGFGGVRWGTRFAFRDMLNNLTTRGISCSILQPIPDLDRPADLRELTRLLAASPTRRMLASAVWRFLKARYPALSHVAKMHHRRRKPPQPLVGIWIRK